MRLGLILCAFVALSACATVPRMHSSEELSRVALGCGLPRSDLVQEPELRKVLFLFTVGPSREERACVGKWARKKRLHLAYIEGINRVGQ